VQTYRDFELIVVDDSSSDDSLSVLRGFSDPRLRIITHHTNMGAAASRNDAMLSAQSEFIAIMDADDVCAPNRLERQVAFLDANPRVGLLGCGVYHNIDVSGAVLHTVYLPEDNQTIQRTLLKRWCFLHSSIMFRRAVQERVGGYRDVFEPAEDHDFVLRALEHCEAHNLREPLVSYRVNPKGLTVVGHRKVQQLREVAVRMAQRRRSGQSEDLNIEMASLLESMRGRTVRRGVASPVQAWRNSIFAAQRYYGLGSLELCAGDPARARLCFIRSLQTNMLFLKSWFALALSLMPFTADLLKCAFWASIPHDSETASVRRSAKEYTEQRTTIVESTRSH
jgi:glycosyltransferase involved in cell wall biosynthesis